MREIEKANPDTLYGVFGDAQWTNKDRLSDALLKVGLAGLPFCSAHANPRANHSHRRAHKWLMNTTVCVCYGEEVSADFERREGGAEGNRRCFRQAIGPRSHT